MQEILPVTFGASLVTQHYFFCFSQLKSTLYTLKLHYVQVFCFHTGHPPLIFYFIFIFLLNASSAKSHFHCLFAELLECFSISKIPELVKHKARKPQPYARKESIPRAVANDSLFLIY